MQVSKRKNLSDNSYHLIIDGLCSYHILRNKRLYIDTLNHLWYDIYGCNPYTLNCLKLSKLQWKAFTVVGKTVKFTKAFPSKILHALYKYVM